MRHFGHIPIVLILFLGMMVFRLASARFGQRPGGPSRSSPWSAMGLGRGRGLQPERLWIVPALMLALTLFVFWRTPPYGIAWAFVAGAFALGTAVGWWRGSLMRLSIDPRTGSIAQQASPLFPLMLIGLVLLRFALRAFVGGEMARQATGGVIDASMAFTLAMFSAQRLEMFLRATQLRKR